MPSERLTKRIVDDAQPRTDKANCDLYIWDTGKGAVAGFGLKVTPAGGKSFVMQYRMRGARFDRRYKIGRFGDWTVETARDRARDLRRLIDAGTDPLEHDKGLAKAAEAAKRDAVDRAFRTVAKNWIAAYKVERRARGAKAGRVRSESTIEMAETAVAFLSGKLGDLRIDEIGARELQTAFDKIPAGQLAKRRNTFASARLLWGWARRQHLVDGNPLEVMEPPPAPPSRDRVLNDDELSLVWRATKRMGYPFGPLYRLLALTGARREEVAAMKWEELDRDAATWHVPASRTKNGLAHIVPLAPAAVAELDAIAPKDDWPPEGLVFTVTGETAVSGHSAAKKRLEAAIGEIVAQEGGKVPADWRLHDLRRTVATGLQRLGVRFEVTEAALNHISGSRGGIAGVYQRHEWAAEKREALAAWAGHVEGLAQPRAVKSTRVGTHSRSKAS